MKIILIGTYPPPYGGISVHIKRMKMYLENKDVSVTVFSKSKKFNDISENILLIKSYKSFIFRIPYLKADVLHFHSTDIKLRVLMGFYKIFNKKIILTVHGESLNDQLDTSSFFIKHLLLFSLKRLDKIICVNPKLVNKLIDYGFNKDKLIYIPAYNNPIENIFDTEKISKEVWTFIDSAEFLVSANGAISFNNNEDLYGIDLLIELIRKLKTCRKDVKLIIALLGAENQNETEKKYYNELKHIINKLDLQKDIFIYEVKDTEFYPILKKSKLFIRPTNTDGDAISVREALYYKVPSIASDVVQRPEGTVLFKTRDIDDLYNKTIEVIENYDFYKDKLNDVVVEDNAERIFDIYKEITN